MNNDKLTMLKQELRIKGKEYIVVKMVKPAVYFYSNMYPVPKVEGAEDKNNRKYITKMAEKSIGCYGLTGAGLVMEALVIDKRYGEKEEWEVLAFTDCLSICTLNPVGHLKKQVGLDDKFNYGGSL